MTFVKTALGFLISFHCIFYSPANYQASNSLHLNASSTLSKQTLNKSQTFDPGIETQNTKGLSPGESTVLTFSSKIKGKERQHLNLWFEKAGNYTLSFINANPRYSNHWLIWDYIALKDQKYPLFEIGESEAPPHYSDLAFDEFCHQDDCVMDFRIGSHHSRKFPKEINDHDILEIKINFEVKSRFARKNLDLDLSTLFSSHNNVEHYKMRVKLE